MVATVSARVLLCSAGLAGASALGLAAAMVSEQGRDDLKHLSPWTEMTFEGSAATKE